MEMNTIPIHAQVAVRSTDGLQYLLLEEAEKLEVQTVIFGHLNNQDTCPCSP